MGVRLRIILLLFTFYIVICSLRRKEGTCSLTLVCRFTIGSERMNEKTFHDFHVLLKTQSEAATGKSSA